MYSERELTRLAIHKAALQRAIALRRTHLTEAAAQVARPLELADRVVSFWRRLPPLAQFAAVPLGLLVQHTVFRRSKLLGAIVRWGPLVFGAVRSVSAAFRRPASAESGPLQR